MYGWKATISIFGSHEERIQGMYKTRLYGTSNSYTSNHYTCISYHNTCNAPPPQQFFPSYRIPKVLITEYYWYFYNICYMPSGTPEVNLLWGAQSFVMTHCFPPQITNPIWNPVYVSMCLLRYQGYKPLWNSYLWISFSISWYLTCYCSIFLRCGLQLNREWEHVMSWVWQQEDSDYWKMMDACMGRE